MCERKTAKINEILKLSEGEEITIEYKGKKFIVTASPFHDGLLALKTDNDKDAVLIDSLDCISEFV